MLTRLLRPMGMVRLCRGKLKSDHQPLAAHILIMSEDIWRRGASVRRAASHPCGRFCRSGLRRKARFSVSIVRPQDSPMPPKVAWAWTIAALLEPYAAMNSGLRLIHRAMRSCRRPAISPARRYQERRLCARRRRSGRCGQHRTVFIGDPNHVEFVLTDGADLAPIGRGAAIEAGTALHRLEDQRADRAVARNDRRARRRVAKWHAHRRVEQREGVAVERRIGDRERAPASCRGRPSRIDDALSFAHWFYRRASGHIRPPPNHRRRRDHVEILGSQSPRGSWRAPRQIAT